MLVLNGKLELKKKMLIELKRFNSLAKYNNFKSL